MLFFCNAFISALARNQWHKLHYSVRNFLFQKELTLADIRPFHGMHYNQSLIKDMAKVICPPYDIIPPQLQQELHERSEYNFIRIEYGLESPHDSNTDNKYTRAAAAMDNWLKKNILIKDEKPCIYIDEHTFIHQGKTKKRRSISAIVKLEQWDRKIIRPHEGTLAKAKSDRLSLLWALSANTSPIMALYEDKQDAIGTTLSKQLKKKPLYNVGKTDGESHRFWAVSDEETINRVRDCLKDKPLYIADGHHRYESALNNQRERRSASGLENKELPYDFVMMTLIDMDDPGLVILPAHRMVSGLPPSAIDALASRLETFFIIEEETISETKLRAQINRLLGDSQTDSNLVLCGLKKDKLLSQSLRDAESVKSMFPAFHSEVYQTLDVSIVDHVILEELLGITQDKMGSYLNWVHDPVMAVEKVLANEYQLGIIVNPVKPEAIKAIADIGDRMPKKSTYFYPKVPAGLVSYHF
jgi:uncharacterized protein (DUF1015 family)